MQTITDDGLRPASGELTRCFCQPIHNADKLLSDYLLQMWSEKTPTEVKEILSREDIEVTNKSDKDSQIKKLESLSHELVRRRQKKDGEAKPLDELEA